MLVNSSVLKMIFCLSMVFISGNVLASQSERQVIGRYVTKETVKYDKGLDSFEKVSAMTFPSSVKTVGGAITMVIDDSGYSLLSTEKSEKSVSNVLSLRLPKDHRNLDEMSKKDILQTLMGPGFVLVLDPVSRKLTFKLRESYASL